MTVVNFNNISGINSITAESNSLNFYDSAGRTLSIGASVSGNITGNVTGNLTGNINSSGISTVTTLNATSIVGVTTAGITTAYVTSINDGPLSGARNRIINGDMRLDQRNNGASVTTSVIQVGTYTVDRWLYYNDVASKRTIQRSSVAPVGFTSSLAVTVIATDTVGPQQYIRQGIEGYNIADLNWGSSNAKPVVLSFWVRSSVTGQHGGSIQNSASPTYRSYPFAYTINAQNTWEYKTIIISGDTSGSWNIDNGVGISLIFENGPGYQAGTAGVWDGVNRTTSTGSVNLCATNGATWYITGVQLEAGTVATPFERRSYGQELALCQRYYEKGTSQMLAYRVDTGSAYYSNYWSHPYKQTKRASPILTVTMTIGATFGWGTTTEEINVTGYVYNNAGTWSSGAGMLAGTWTASAEL